jgi:hypothetical protein
MKTPAVRWNSFTFLGRGDGSLARLRKVRRLLCPLQLRPLVGRREQPQGNKRGSHRQTSSNQGDNPSPALCVAGRVGKKTLSKNPKKPQKNPQKMFFWGFFKLLIFYEINTNFFLPNRFFVNK